MRALPLLASAALLAAAAGAARAQVSVGGKLEAPVLEGLANSKAASVADFAGRAVLYEFFAYW